MGKIKNDPHGRFNNVLVIPAGFEPAIFRMRT